MRSRAALGRVAVVVAWLGAMAGAIALDYPALLWVAIPATLLAGVLLDWWWAAAVPWVAVAVLFAVAVAQDPSCSGCGEDPWNIQFVYAAFVACSLSALMAIGVGARRAVRLVRRGSPPPVPRVP
jgi:hypothetical protein